MSNKPKSPLLNPDVIAQIMDKRQENARIEAIVERELTFYAKPDEERFIP